MSYSEKRDAEIRAYENVTNVHDLPEIFHYWSNKYIRPKLQLLGFGHPNEFYVQYIARALADLGGAPCHILSLGAGNCDTELELASMLIESGTDKFVFHCLDLNPQMLARGADSAQKAGLKAHFSFIETDINSWDPQSVYNIIIANQSLHHFVELEQLIEKSYRSLDQKGFFVTHDMIGRNGHMRWPEALELVQAFWSLLDDKHKWNHQLQRLEQVYENWDCSLSGGFEGVRAQDILPLLLKEFHFDCFVGFANLINVFIDRAFGHNFDLSDPRDRHFIDFVAGLDDYFIEAGKIKPTQMLAAMTKSPGGGPRVYKHLTPEFCVRDPNL